MDNTDYYDKRHLGNCLQQNRSGGASYQPGYRLHVSLQVGESFLLSDHQLQELTEHSAIEQQRIHVENQL